MDFKNQCEQIEANLAKLGTKKRAEYEKKYLKSPLKHFGVTVPQLRTLAKAWYKEHLELGMDEYVEFVRYLFNSEYHEVRSVAIFLLTNRANELTIDHMDLFEELVHKSYSWAHVDEIATHLVGAVVESDRSAILLLPAWSQSDNFWLRRTAILAQISLFRKGKGSMKMFRQVSTSQFREGEDWSADERFFIRKAIGWALRERGKEKPESVVKYVNAYKDKMSNLTYKEATRNLPINFKKKLQPKD